MTLAFLWLHKVSSMRIVEITGIDNKTLQHYIKKFQLIIATSLNNEDTIIGGPGIEVQLDESKFGRRKYEKGHRVEGVWVFGGVENTVERKVFLKVVQDRTKETLEAIIKRHVKAGSIIVTDGWKGYFGVGEMKEYTHHWVNHSLNFVDPESRIHTNSIEGTWFGVKQQVSHRQRTAVLIEEKLIEFIWRRLHKNNVWDSFVNAMRITHIE